MAWPQKKISLALLLLFATAGVFAGPRDQSERAALRELLQQQRDADRKESQEERRALEAKSVESVQATPDGGKRHGKMSPEEKRALRQQINEAGQDLYFGKR